MIMAPWLVLLMAVVLAVGWLVQRRDSDGNDVVLRVLDRRLAEGDLTVEEHAQRRQALQDSSHGASPRPGGRGPTVAVIAAAALVGLLLVWLG